MRLPFKHPRDNDPKGAGKGKQSKDAKQEQKGKCAGKYKQQGKNEVDWGQGASSWGERWRPRSDHQGKRGRRW